MNFWVGASVIDADTYAVKNIFMKDDVYTVFNINIYFYRHAVRPFYLRIKFCY